jgi:hypothetical protein
MWNNDPSGFSGFGRSFQSQSKNSYGIRMDSPRLWVGSIPPFEVEIQTGRDYLKTPEKSS